MESMNEARRESPPEAEYKTLAAWARSGEGKRSIKRGVIDLDRVVHLRGQDEEIVWIVAGILERMPSVYIYDFRNLIRGELGLTGFQALGALVVSHVRWEWEHARDAEEERDSSDADKWNQALHMLQKVQWNVAPSGTGAHFWEARVTPRPSFKGILETVGLKSNFQ